MWQEIGAAVLVAASAAYLARKLFGLGRRSPRKKSSAFVPLSDLKRRKP